MANHHRSVVIHPTAIVDDGAEIGSGVSIGAYTIIGPKVKVGDGTWIGPHVVIEGHTELGPENMVYQFASLGSHPQDLKYHGEPSTLIIGARNKIREFVTLQPGTEHGRMSTRVGDENLFMANCHVGHDCIVGSKNVFANSTALAGHVTIDNNVILGGLVGIHQFCRIGDFSLIGAGSMVSSDVPPYCLVQGDRAHLRGVNVIGLERGGFQDTEIKDIRRTYRHLFATVGHLEAKVKSLPADLKDQPVVRGMVEFITSSKRGVCKPLRELRSGGPTE